MADTKKTTAQKAATQKTGPEKTEKAEKADTSAERTSTRWLDAQKRIIDFQRSAFESGYNMVTSIQERQEEAVSSWLEKSERVPAEAKEAIEAWIGASRSGRETYRDTVERTFDLANHYIDGVAEKRAQA